MYQCMKGMKKEIWYAAWSVVRSERLGIRDIDDNTPCLLKHAIECRVLRGLATELTPTQQRRKTLQRLMT